MKTNLGHLDAAAGVTGLIKIALVAASQSDSAAEPALHEAESEARSREQPVLRERNAAGVEDASRECRGAPASARSAPAAPTRTSCLRKRRSLPRSGPSRPWQLLTLSAKTPDALDRATANLSEHLNELADGRTAERADANWPTPRSRCKPAAANSFTAASSSARMPADGAAALDAARPETSVHAPAAAQGAAGCLHVSRPGSAVRRDGRRTLPLRAVFRPKWIAARDLSSRFSNCDLRTVMFRRPRTEEKPERAARSDPLHAAGAVRDRIRARQALDVVGHQAVGHDRPQRRRIRGRLPRRRVHARRCADAGRAPRRTGAGAAGRRDAGRPAAGERSCCRF